jgi:hypothetical protein
VGQRALAAERADPLGRARGLLGEDGADLVARAPPSSLPLGWPGILRRRTP